MRGASEASRQINRVFAQTGVSRANGQPREAATFGGVRLISARGLCGTDDVVDGFDKAIAAAHPVSAGPTAYCEADA